jgi:hypothetical protein
MFKVRYVASGGGVPSQPKDAFRPRFAVSGVCEGGDAGLAAAHPRSRECRSAELAIGASIHCQNGRVSSAAGRSRTARTRSSAGRRAGESVSWSSGSGCGGWAEPRHERGKGIYPIEDRALRTTPLGFGEKNEAPRMGLRSGWQSRVSAAFASHIADSGRGSRSCPTLNPS